MCLIVDADVIHQLFNPDSRTQAGERLFDWLERGTGQLVVGGQLRHELNRSGQGYRDWLKEALLAGKILRMDDNKVETITAQIKRERKEYEKSDPHVLALALVSGSRLLHSNDRRLQRAFKDQSLIDNPKGRVFPTPETSNNPRMSNFSQNQQKLLRKKDLCRRPH